MALQACGTFTGHVSLKAQREASSSWVGQVEGRLQGDLDRVRIVQKWNDQWSVGRANLVDDAQPPESIALPELDVCATQLAYVGEETLELVARNEAFALRDEAFATFPVKLPGARTPSHRELATIPHAIASVRYFRPVERDGGVMATEVRLSLLGCARQVHPSCLVQNRELTSHCLNKLVGKKQHFRLS